MKRFIIITLIAALSAAWIFPVMADNTTKDDKLSEIDSKLDSITKQKNQIYKEKNKLEGEKKEILNNQKEENKEYKELISELESINKEIAVYEDSLKETEERYNKQLEAFKVRLRSMYQNSYISYIDVLADSKNLVEFFQRVQIVSSIAKKDKDIVKEVQNAREDVLYKKQLVENVKLAKQNELDRKKDTIDALIATRQGLEERIKKSKEELKRLEDQEDSLIEQSTEIAGHIRNITNGNQNYAGGTMLWPVPSSKKIDSPFGMRIHPILKKKKMHTGVDIDANHGVSIVAANHGTVIFSGWRNGYGYTVIIDHGGGITTLYAHCSKLLVKKGDKIQRGTIVAKAGRTGMATGPHLHFEVRINGNVVNPLKYIS